MGLHLLNISNFKQTNVNGQHYLGILLEVIQKVRHFSKQHFLTPVHLCHLLKNDELWHDTEKCFLSICSFLSISHIKGCRNHIMSKDVEKLRNCCYNLCVHSLFHIDAQVLTSHFRKQWSYDALDVIVQLSQRHM